MKYYCIKNKHNNVIGYGNIKKEVTEDYKKQFNNEERFEIIELEDSESRPVENLVRQGVSQPVQTAGLAPCDCKDERTALKLKEQGISFNNYSLDIRPSVVSISIGQAQMQMPMLMFKRFAEWYLTKQ